MTVGTLDLAEIQQLENEHQPPLYAKREIALVRGEGAYLFDSDGRRYLDAMSNYGVAILGHADPEYAAALTEQLQTLATGHQSFYSDVRAELLREIAAIAPAGLTRYFLSNSGAEAIEAAIKFARVATGRPNLVAAKRGYHGRTLGALAATADQKYRAPFEPLAPHGDPRLLQRRRRARGRRRRPDRGHPARADPGRGRHLARRRLSICRPPGRSPPQRGALLIADEIQTGFRTGAPWAIDASGVVPDILVHRQGACQRIPDRSDDVHRGHFVGDPERRPRHDVRRQPAGLPRRDRDLARAA